jgi:hypothetical protein
MKIIKRLFVLPLALFLLYSCASSSPLKEKYLSAKEPVFEGVLSPISIPIKPEYKPAKMRFTGSFVEMVDKRIEEKNVQGTINVSPMGELHLWEVRMLSVEQNGRTYSRNLPLLELRLLTDKQGLVKEKELSFPALSPSEVGEIKAEQMSLIHAACAAPLANLSSNSIRTGDILAKWNSETLFGNLAKNPETLSNFYGKKDLPEKNSWEYGLLLNFVECYFDALKSMQMISVLKGRAYYEGKRVLVGSVDSYVDIAKELRNNPKLWTAGKLKIDAEQNFRLNMRITGFSLIDETSYQTVKSEFMMEMTTPTGIERIYQTYLAEGW